jgi:hypothetical protein
MPIRQGTITVTEDGWIERLTGDELTVNRSSGTVENA